MQGRKKIIIKLSYDSNAIKIDHCIFIIFIKILFQYIFK